MDYQRAHEDYNYGKNYVRFGDEAPNFTADSQLGQITFYECINYRYAVLVTFAQPFSPVGATEIGALSKLSEEFQARNTALFGLCCCCSDKNTITQWIHETEEIQNCKVNFPILCDTADCMISNAFGLRRRGGGKGGGMIQSTMMVVIDLDKRVQMKSEFNVDVGRNFFELIRSLDALQLSSLENVSTPANWCTGEDVFVPKNVNNDTNYDNNIVEIKSWYRIVTPQPNFS